MPPSSFRPRAARLVEVTLARPLVPWFACARLKTAPIDPPTRFSSSSSSPTRHFPLSLSPSFFPRHAPSPLFRERNTRTQDPARYEPDLRRILRVPPLSIVVPATSATSFCYIRVVSLVVPSFLPEAYPAYPREFGREREGRGGGFTKKKKKKKKKRICTTYNPAPHHVCSLWGNFGYLERGRGFRREERKMMFQSWFWRRELYDTTREGI